MNSHLGTWELTPEDYQLTEQLKRAREQKLYEDVDYCGLPSTSKLWNVIHERMSSSREDIRSAGFWRAVVAEYIGTAIVVLVGCGAWIGNWGDQPSIVQVALAFGLAVSLVMWTLRHVSRSHLNPAISIAMVMSRRISLARALAYTIVQCLGAATGVGILKGATPSTQIGTLGATTPHPDITAAQAFTVEMVITFVWVFALFATSDPNRDDLPDSAPMCIGMAVTICHLYAAKYTGASMNPARSFGPAVATGIWTEHWVYWFGPITGAIVAALTYDNAFAVNSSWAKAKAYLLDNSYEPDGYQQVKTPQETLMNDLTSSKFDANDTVDTKDDTLKVTEVEFSL